MAEGLNPQELTMDEVKELDRAGRLELEKNFEAALGTLEETEEEAAQIISRRGEAILALFATMDPETIDRQLTADNSAFAATFSLGFSTLGALDIAGRWYRESAAAFNQGDYTKALSSFITAGTAEEITPGIEETKKDFREKYGKEMTLADFLDRCPYYQRDGEDPEKISAITASADNQTIPAKESFFDFLLQKLGNIEPPVLPSALTSPLFGDTKMGYMYSPQEALMLSTIKTKPNLKPNRFNPSFLVTTPSEVQYWLSSLENGFLPNVGTPEFQLFYTSLVQLAANNPHKVRGDRVDPFAYIPLVEYGEMRRTPESLENTPGPLYSPRPMKTTEDRAAEANRVKKNLSKLRKSIRTSGDILKHIETEFPGTEGTKTQIIGNVTFAKIEGTEFIVVEFLQSAADALTASGYLTMFDAALLRVDKRNHSAFSIGIAITYQANYDKNVENGTDNRLSVKTLIEKGRIETLEDLKKKGRRDWKALTLKPLEAALDELKKVDFLASWKYVDPRTHEEITRKTAAGLPYNLWCNLRVEWELVRDQEESRRKERLARLKEADTKKNSSGSIGSNSKSSGSNSKSSKKRNKARSH